MLDTNVWLDWLVFDDASVSHLRQAVAAGRAEIYIDDACLAELARVLAYPLMGAPLEAEMQTAHLATTANVTRPFDREYSILKAGHEARLPLCRDPDDQKFLQLALDCKADALITKDRALLELALRKRRPLSFRIVTPADLVL